MLGWNSPNSTLQGQIIEPRVATRASGTLLPSLSCSDKVRAESNHEEVEHGKASQSLDVLPAKT